MSDVLEGGLENDCNVRMLNVVIKYNYNNGKFHLVYFNRISYLILSILCPSHTTLRRVTTALSRAPLCLLQ